MYQDFFGFTEMPFNITPDPKFLFLSPTHQEALAHLRYGVGQKKGFIVLTGEVGCGKTTLCRTLLNELSPNEYDTALILNPRVQENQLLKDILAELGEPVTDLLPMDLVNRIYKTLLKRVSEGKNIVMIIDEAQNLSFEVLEQIRLLSNLETDEQKLLQIILMGQPELKDKLKHRALRQLKQRVLVFYDLKPLTFKETKAYVNHRLSLAQCNNKPEFSRMALRKVYKRSSGIPRIINNICDKSLLAAYTRTSKQIRRKDVKRALNEMEIA